MTVDLRVTRVRTYPVKSLAGNDVDSAVVKPWGLAGDRRWGLVDHEGTNITARMVHHLLGLRAEDLDGSSIRIVERNGESVTVETPVGERTTPVGFSRLPEATPAGARADDWLSARVGRPVRLVWQHDPTQRSIGEHHAGLPGESLSLADAAPLLLVTTASMKQLNDWVSDEESPLDILRFRPNVVVEGGLPFVEDEWRTLQIGAVTFRKTVLCDRCVMTTIEPTTLVRGREPLRTLAQRRRWDGKTWFGIRIAPVGITSGDNATISVGDTVVVTE